MATSKFHQFLEDIDEKVLECAICFKRLQNPKSLNCLHSFCLTCLEDWVKKKGKLTCPTCTKSYPLPEGGLQKLPPNTFLNNLLETFEQYDKRDQIMKCVCGKVEEYYCQDCRHYLCSSCSDHHKLLPLSANHKLHAVEDVRSMTPQDFALLNPPLCSLHSKPLELYCQDCKTTICIHCTLIEHKGWEGKHKPISISEAFQTFKQTWATLEKKAHCFQKKLQDGLGEVVANATNLEKCRDKSLMDIDNHIQDIINKVNENGNKMKKEVETIYETKKRKNDVQLNELKTQISEVNTKLSFVKQLLKSDEATAVKLSETFIIALRDRINELPKTEPKDNGQIHFIKNSEMSSLQQHHIGNIIQARKADCLTLKGVTSRVIQDQDIFARVIKMDNCDYAYQLKATWTHPTGETKITQVKNDNDGGYVVRGKCPSPGVCRLNVSVDGELIKQSPMIIKVEKEGLVNTIQLCTNMTYNYTGQVKCEDDCLLVSCRTNKIYKYKQSGKYMGKVTIPQGVKIYSMYKMKSKIAVSDEGNGCIKIVKMNGEVIKSIGQGILGNPAGIHVDEASNAVYVADWKNECVCVFDIESGTMIRKIKSPGKTIGVVDVALKNQGNILALERDSKKSCNNRLQQFDNEGRFMKVLLKGDEHRTVGFGEVVVDEDDNIIIASDNKLQLFSSDGKFIKRIDKPENGITDPSGVCLISQHPRKVAIVDNGDNTMKIYNY
ncbi:tripartite motif-containing protein 2-like [Anneissia japonica]|uniref:tripartite motif-containing protein 2-like n=1 Tax=Anneissia japonica TaxID=1529436 RepID=UPI0014257B04|nr:tripartite motif-containing protein 2-like [Anneissia japonica]